MKIVMESVLPAPSATVFDLLLNPSTLVFLAHGKVTYHGYIDFPKEWRVGQPVDLRPQFGNGRVGSHIVTFTVIDRDQGILKTVEKGDVIKSWKHTMTVVDRGENECVYTDTIHLNAGWRTPIFWVFVVRFYKHRHRRWRELLAQMKNK